MNVSPGARLRASVVALVLVACTAAGASAQGFVGLGGGASFPTGSGGDAMRTG
jgi:hypothetical protein